jgi:hypothetical protein
VFIHKVFSTTGSGVSLLVFASSLTFISVISFVFVIYSHIYYKYNLLRLMLHIDKKMKTEEEVVATSTTTSSMEIDSGASSSSVRNLYLHIEILIYII